MSQPSGSGGKKSRRLSGEPALDPDVNFPPSSKFQHPTKLPSWKSIISVMRYLTSGEKKTMSANEAAREVCKDIYCKYFHDSVFCIPFETMFHKVKRVWDLFKIGKLRLGQGRSTSKEVKAYEDLVAKKETLFDMSTNDPARIENCEKDWGVKMSEREHIYLADQQSERRMECDKGVDPVWYRAIMRKQRARELEDIEYVQKRARDHAGKSLEEIDNILMDQGEVPSASPESSTAGTPAKDTTATPVQVEDNNNGGKKRKRLFEEVEEEENDEIGRKYRHIRDSERNVKDSFYQTSANLAGQGFSIAECAIAVVEVGNGMFGRKWKLSKNDQDNLDVDTIPEDKAIRKALRQVEAQSLNLVVKEMQRGKEDNRMVTLASDSTTRRQVGQFIGQGIHIGRDSALPIPLLGITGETKEDIASQLGMGMELLSVVSGVDVKDLMGQVDTLLTDSVEHNKGVNVIIQDMFDLDKPAGQLFCGTHTTLGFSNTMNKLIMEIELKMKLETVLSKFMVGMDLDSKNGSLAGQALDMQLKLVAPEYRHKSWNYHGLYTNYVDQQGLDLSLFAYKDHRYDFLLPYLCC